MNYSKVDNQAMTRLSISSVIEGYSDLVIKYVIQGWHPFLLTFMFRRLCGMSRTEDMTNELERFYSSLVKRVTRRPCSKYQRDFRPILITVPDFPRIGRLHTLNDLSINDGLHAHGILLMPPRSRLKEDLVTHFANSEKIYVRDRLLRLHIEPIETEISHVVAYVFKSVAQRRQTFDSVIIFPKETGVLRDEVICL